MNDGPAKIIQFLRTAKLYCICCSRKELPDITNYLSEETIRSAMCIYIKSPNDEVGININEIVLLRFDSKSQKMHLIDFDQSERAEYEFVVLFYANKRIEIDALTRLRLLLYKFGYSYRKIGICYKTDKSALVVYSSKDEPLCDENGKAIIYISPIFTYGDCYIIYPGLVAYMKKNHVGELFIYHAGYASYRAFSHLFRQARHVNIKDNGHIEEIIKNRYNNKNVVFGNYLDENCGLEKRGYHILQFFLEAMHLDYCDIAEIMKKVSMPNILIHNSMIANIKKIKIGVQFYSTTDDNKTVSYPYRKSWPINAAQDFVQLCIANGYEVFQFTAHEGKIYSNCHNCVDFQFDLLYNIIKELDIFVGIDSVFGHLSALLGVKSITIFGGASAFWVYSDNTEERQNVSFVPIRLNFALSSVEGDIRNILPEKVFDTMMYVLNGKIRVNDSLVTYDTINNEYIS